MVADEYDGGETRVNALHHAERSRERANDRDRNVSRKLVEQERLTVAVRVADDEFSRARVTRALDRGEDVTGHPLARLRILEARRRELIDRRDAADALHI